MSATVTGTSLCPVMVIKMPRPEAGAFLTGATPSPTTLFCPRFPNHYTQPLSSFLVVSVSAVLPRRVCIHINGTSCTDYACEWAVRYLLIPDDEVYLLCSRKKDKSLFEWFAGGKRCVVHLPFALERVSLESNANVSFSDREQNIPLTVRKTLATIIDSPLKVLMELNSIFLTTVTVWNDTVRLKAMRLCLTPQTRAWSSA